MPISRNNLPNIPKLDNLIDYTVELAKKSLSTGNTVISGINSLGKLVYRAPKELTISSGEITVTQCCHCIDTESDASTDFLDTINGGVVGQIIHICPANSSRDILIQDAEVGGGNIRLKGNVTIENFPFNSPGGGSGTYYCNGFYYAPAADANLTQASPTVTLGTANIGYGAHAFLVAGGAGAVDAGSCSIVCSGTSLSVLGVRTAGDSETIVPDITAMSTDEYFETTKYWIGQVVYTLTPAGAAVYNADFNYGYASHAFRSSHVHFEAIKVDGRCGSSDSDFDIRMLLHDGTGWTYSPAAFVPGGTEINSWQNVYAPESQIANGQPFGGQILINYTIEAGDGLVIAVDTGANNSVELMNFTAYYQSPPRWWRLHGERVFTAIFDGTYWMEA